MHKRHVVIVSLAFLLGCISLYFGIRIFNANENIHLTELNEIDNIHHDDVSLVPALTMLASLITLPLLIGIIIFQMITIKKSEVRSIKNISIGMLVAAIIILIVDLLTLSNPVYFDFSQWGYVWICIGLIIIAGNLLCYAYYKLGKPPD